MFGMKINWVEDVDTWMLFRAVDVFDYLLDIHSILFSLNNYTGLYNFNFQHLQRQSRAQYFNPLITLESSMKPLVIYPKYSNVTDARCKETVFDHKTSLSAIFSLPSFDQCLCHHIILWYGFLHVSKSQSMINMQIKHCNFQVFGGNELLLLEVNFKCLWKTLRGELLLSCLCH